MNDAVVQPIKGKSRIASLDFLRGTAILGILFINIENFAYPDSWSPWKFGFGGPGDQSTRFWVYFLTQGKFATMFTLLFGVGFYLFLERLENKKIGIRAMDIYARRLLWLFIIGVVHAYFIWDGDILYHYALCGFLLFPFRSFSNRSLLVSMGILIGIQFFNSYEKVQNRKESYQNYLEILKSNESDRTALDNKKVDYWESFLGEKYPDTATYQAPKKTYVTGLLESYQSIKVRKGQLYYQGFLFPSLMVMLLGIYLYRSGIFVDLNVWKNYWLITTLVLLTGLSTNWLKYQHWSYDYQQPILSNWKELTFTIHKQLLGVGYILLFNGLFQSFLKRRRPGVVSKIGRMALSNYLLQSILLGFLFYGYGLGHYNRYSRSELIMLVILIWMVQIIATQLWSNKHEQGPVEWVWKRLTYGLNQSRKGTD